MHDLQLFDTTFMEISGRPVPLHPPPPVQNYKFNKLTIFLAYHKLLGASSACTLHGMHPGEFRGEYARNYQDMQRYRVQKKSQLHSCEPEEGFLNLCQF